MTACSRCSGTARCSRSTSTTRCSLRRSATSCCAGASSPLWRPRCVYGDEVIGVICVAERERPERRFTVDERRLLELLAGPAAIAIRNARAYRARAERTRGLAAVLEASRAITAIDGPGRGPPPRRRGGRRGRASLPERHLRVHAPRATPSSIVRCTSVTRPPTPSPTTPGYAVHPGRLPGGPRHPRGRRGRRRARLRPESAARSPGVDRGVGREDRRSACRWRSGASLSGSCVCTTWSKSGTSSPRRSSSCGAWPSWPARPSTTHGCSTPRRSNGSGSRALSTRAAPWARPSTSAAVVEAARTAPGRLFAAGADVEVWLSLESGGFAPADGALVEAALSARTESPPARSRPWPPRRWPRCSRPRWPRTSARRSSSRWSRAGAPRASSASPPPRGASFLPGEVEALQVLANQTAVALANAGALPAGAGAGDPRRPHGALQSPPLPGATASGVRAGAALRAPAFAADDRRRRLQAVQRRARTPAGRRGPARGRPRSCIGSTRQGVDIPARYGGEEFAVILPHTTASGAECLGQRLREQLAELDEDLPPRGAGAVVVGERLRERGRQVTPSPAAAAAGTRASRSASASPPSTRAGPMRPTSSATPTRRSTWPSARARTGSKCTSRAAEAERR